MKKIIKLLGGYTKEEYDASMNRAIKEVNKIEDDVHNTVYMLECKIKTLETRNSVLYKRIADAKKVAEEVKESKLKNVCKGHYLTYIDDIVKVLDKKNKRGRKKLK